MATTTAVPDRRTAGSLSPMERRALMAAMLTTKRARERWANVYGGLQIALVYSTDRPFDDLRPSEAARYNKLVHEALDRSARQLMVEIDAALQAFIAEHPDATIRAESMADARGQMLRAV